MRKIKTAVIPVGVAFIMSLSACGVGAQEVAHDDLSGEPQVQTGGEAAGGGHMTRSKLYGSLDEMVDDSSLIVTGAPIEQQVAADVSPTTDFTLSTFVVDAVVKGEDVAVGASIIVRQAGSERQPPPTPLLTTGGSYMLFLTPSGLKGELADQYYVTGANAGVYGLAPDAAGVSSSRSSMTEGVDLAFTQLDGTEGERLPAEVSIDDLEPLL